VAIKSEKKSFRFTPQVLIRLVIFCVAVYYSFSYLMTSSGTLATPSILGTQTVKPYSDWLYQQLPPESRNLVENFNQNPTVVYVENKINDFKTQLNGFPETQIKEIQKQLVKNISDKLIESIENSTSP